MKLQNVHFNVEPELSARLSGCVWLMYGSSIAVRSSTWHRLKGYSHNFRTVHLKKKLRATDVNCFYCGVNFAVRAYEIPPSVIQRGFYCGKQYKEGIL